jgi:hypothetical protein
MPRGGKRYHPPGRQGGRPKNQYPVRQLKVQMSDEEWEKFLAAMPRNSREKALKLLEWLAQRDSG